MIDPFAVSWEEIPEAIALGTEAALEDVRRRYRLITNVVEEMEWWAGATAKAKTVSRTIKPVSVLCWMTWRCRNRFGELNRRWNEMNSALAGAEKSSRSAAGAKYCQPVPGSTDREQFGKPGLRTNPGISRPRAAFQEFRSADSGRRSPAGSQREQAAGPCRCRD